MQDVTPRLCTISSPPVCTTFDFLLFCFWWCSVSSGIAPGRTQGIKLGTRVRSAARKAISALPVRVHTLLLCPESGSQGLCPPAFCSERHWAWAALQPC